MSAAALPVIVVNRAQVRAFALAPGQRAKTDPIDASVIARFVASTKPDIRALPDEATRLLADLTARRRQITQMITAEKHRLRMVSVPRLKKSVTRLLKALEKELAALDSDIDDMVRGSPVWREKENLLKSVPGGGESERCRASKATDRLKDSSQLMPLFITLSISSAISHQPLHTGRFGHRQWRRGRPR